MALDDADDVGESCDVEHFLDLRLHILHHHLAFTGVDAFLQHEEDAQALRRGVFHVGAVNLDVGRFAFHQWLDVFLELKSVGGVEAAFQSGQLLCANLANRDFHIFSLFV